jgi:flagellar basal-body rod protein FlgB
LRSSFADPERRRAAGIHLAAELCRNAASRCRASRPKAWKSNTSALGTSFAEYLAHIAGRTFVMSQGLFGVHAAALELRSQRLGMITSNIANAATPGYKARDLDFAAALKARNEGLGNDNAVQQATRYRVPVMPSLDGNTVEMATEQTAFAENAVAYQATLGFLRGRIETLTRSLKGE